MEPSAPPLLANMASTLSYHNYPRIITAAVQRIVQATSVMYQVPTQIRADFHAISELFNVKIHCIISRFWPDENQHTLVFLAQDYQGEIILSPLYPHS